MKLEKVEKPAASSNDQTECVINKRHLKHRLVLEKFIELLNLIKKLGSIHVLI